LPKDKSFAKRKKYSQEEIKVLPRDRNVTKNK
jgi:hypothetical protein